MAHMTQEQWDEWQEDNGTAGYGAHYMIGTIGKI